MSCAFCGFVNWLEVEANKLVPCSEVAANSKLTISPLSLQAPKNRTGWVNEVKLWLLITGSFTQSEQN